MEVVRLERRRPVSDLSRRLEALDVGARETVPFDRNRVRATIVGRTTRMNTAFPERRFTLVRVGPSRTIVTRLVDLHEPDDGWSVAWDAAVEAARGAVAVMKPRSTYVPLRHGFALWARDAGLGVVVGEWWAWEHQEGWMAQRAAEGALRCHGVPARTWG